MCSVSKIVISPEEYFNFTLLEDDTYSIVAKDVENMPSEVIIPATYNGKAVTEIYYNAFLSLDGDHSFVIPDSITSIDIGCATMHPFIFSGNIIKIEVSKDNATYKSIDGCLYTKDGKILLVYATGKADQTFTLPKDVEIINYGAF